jgi:hypothetical protein
VRTDQADGLEGVVHGIGFGVVPVRPQPVPEDDGRDTELPEEGDEVAPFGPDPQDLVPAAGCDDHRRPGVPGRVADQVYLDRRVVDVDYALRRHALALERPVVPLGLVELVLLQPG